MSAMLRTVQALSSLDEFHRAYHTNGAKLEAVWDAVGPGVRAGRVKTVQGPWAIGEGSNVALGV